MENEKNIRTNECQSSDYRQGLQHVGGINEELGGVDPRADENLIRLSGGH